MICGAVKIPTSLKSCNSFKSCSTICKFTFADSLVRVDLSLPTVAEMEGSDVTVGVVEGSTMVCWGLILAVDLGLV